ncbi:MAG: PTS mannose/fructose/sorbose transporter subunit IIB [Erysipelotrichia bacterium]|nr:PTS mannose/fructose/sorbose transporter subunit IIB [Erysipelotrichia bacterium]NCC54943.1 PTS mannose/fructose/sorbose transporter subunit IIB [Erysipelotrichia bacterium]
MIKALRVDHRLLHGQVAFSWTSAIGADCILLASDTLLSDSLRMQTIKMAKPNGVKVVAKSVEDSINAITSGITDKYKLFIIVENIADAQRVAKALDIKRVNVGGTFPTKAKREIGTAVFVDDKDVEILNEMMSNGIYCFIQGIPTNKEIDIKSLI